jgi:hypothetical protein
MLGLVAAPRCAVSSATRLQLRRIRRPPPAQHQLESRALGVVSLSRLMSIQAVCKHPYQIISRSCTSPRHIETALSLSPARSHVLGGCETLWGAVSWLEGRFISL